MSLFRKDYFPFSCLVFVFFFSQAEPSAPETEKGAGFSSDEEGPNSGTAGGDVEISWPRNRQAEMQKEKTTRKSKREKKEEAAQLFPFEKL